MFARFCGLNSQILHTTASRTASSSSECSTAGVANAQAVSALFLKVSSQILQIAAGFSASSNSECCTASVTTIRRCSYGS